MNTIFFLLQWLTSQADLCCIPVLDLRCPPNQYINITSAASKASTSHIGTAKQSGGYNSGGFEARGIAHIKILNEPSVIDIE